MPDPQLQPDHGHKGQAADGYCWDRAVLVGQKIRGGLAHARCQDLDDPEVDGQLRDLGGQVPRGTSLGSWRDHAAEDN